MRKCEKLNDKNKSKFVLADPIKTTNHIFSRIMHILCVWINDVLHISFLIWWSVLFSFIFGDHYCNDLWDFLFLELGLVRVSISNMGGELLSIKFSFVLGSEFCKTLNRGLNNLLNFGGGHRINFFIFPCLPTFRNMLIDLLWNVDTLFVHFLNCFFGRSSTSGSVAHSSHFFFLMRHKIN